MLVKTPTRPLRLRLWITVSPAWIPLYCRREMDDGVKRDIWSVMEDFSKAPGVKDLNKMKT